MAKDKLPSIGAGKTQASVRDPQRKTVDPPPRDVTAGTMPHGEYTTTSMIDPSRRADARLTRAQGVELMKKLRTLQDRGAKMQDGSYVRSKSDAIRWMIEQPLAS